MALWGLTDDANSAPKWLSTDAAIEWTNDQDNAVFVDLTEAQVASNRDKGLGSPGWNLYNTYVDSDGNTRHRSETLVSAKVTAGAAGDAGVTGNTTTEDNIVADS